MTPLTRFVALALFIVLLALAGLLAVPLWQNPPLDTRENPSAATRERKRAHDDASRSQPLELEFGGTCTFLRSRRDELAQLGLTYDVGEGLSVHVGSEKKHLL